MDVRRALRAQIGEAVDHVGSFASRHLPPHSSLRPPLRALRRRLPAARPKEPLTRLLYEFANSYPSVFFMQIGANDGSKGDYLETYVQARGWRGLLLEPIPYVFANLQSRHGGNPRLTLVNAAIGDHVGTAQLYYLPKDEESDLPFWYDAIASFRKEVILTHAPWIPDIESRVASIEVPTMTFASLCETHSIDSVDLIQIDTEGYDYEIIRQIDFDRIAPVLILFEHYHLGPDEREACRAYLQGHGYSLISNFMDTVAIRAIAEDVRSVNLVKLLTKLRAENSG